MVYLHLPANYTEEEVMLQAKYDKLKRKKKALQVLKTPRQEPERTTPVKKPQVVARDAREIARKLIKSGAIAAIKKAPKREEHSGFKRPRGLTKKSDRPIVSGYQPFAGNSDESRPNIKELYEVMTKYPDEPNYNSSRNLANASNTVVVKGGDVTHNFLRKTFSEFGNIADIFVEPDKSEGYVTFEERGAAESSISILNGSVMNQGILLTVNYSDRKPTTANAASAAKGFINSPRKQEKDGKQFLREMVSYEDDIFM